MKNTVVISAFPACCKNGIFKDTKYSIVCLYPEFSKYCWVDDSADIDPAFPDNYIKGIKESMGKVDFIFVLSHKLIRDALKENNIKYVLIYPDVSLKKEFLDRMRWRGTPSKFIEMMDKNFETYIKEFETCPLGTVSGNLKSDCCVVIPF
jgi:hypothetical protein